MSAAQMKRSVSSDGAEAPVEVEDDEMIDLTHAGASASTATSVPRALPWVEKYRPRSMTDISSQEEVVRSLSASIRSGIIPHLLFYGPPGTGKTSTILAVARDLFGPELMRTRVLELNASDERGIAVVREKVKAFAAGSVGSAGVASRVPPFKLIILDEADSLTQDAQAALRRTMESYSKITRFCIICNYVSRIIEPVASRCSKFRFKPLDRESMLARLKFIAAAEGIPADDATLDELLVVSGGDMRKAITLLQSAFALYGSAISREGVVEVAGVIPTRDVDAAVAAMKAPSGFDAVRKHASSIISNGYGLAMVMDKLAYTLLSDTSIPAEARAVIAERFAIADKRLVDGADEELQLMDVLLAAHRAIQGTPIPADRERLVIA